MADLLREAYDPESFRTRGHLVVDLLADYLAASLAGKEMPVLPWQEPEAALAAFPLDGSESAGSEDIWTRVIRESIHLHHPRYLGHQVCAPLPICALTDMLAAVLNNGSAVYEMGPVNVAMERNVGRLVADQLGFPDQAEAVFTSGGSLGNLTALLAARQARAGYNVWQEGNRDSRSLAVMISDEAHYCLDRSLKIMGLGENGVIRVKPGSGFSLSRVDLEEAYRQALDRGLQIIALVGNACSTSTGIYDKLAEMAAFCRDHGLWFHVDAAHGGAAVFSKKYRHLLTGIDGADSVVLDFHKMLLTPGLNTLVLFRDAADSYAAFAQKASYLWSRNEAREWYNPARRTMECTKKMMGFQAWAILKTYGPQIYDDFVTTVYDLAREFAAMLKKQPDFQLACEPQANIVCFRYLKNGFSREDLNTLNAAIRDRIMKSGKFYLVQTQIGTELFLRTSLMNPFSGMKELGALLDEIRKIEV